jgi:hypothetical protein
VPYNARTRLLPQSFPTTESTMHPVLRKHRPPHARGIGRRCVDSARTRCTWRGCGTQRGSSRAGAARLAPRSWARTWVHACARARRYSLEGLSADLLDRRKAHGPPSPLPQDIGPRSPRPSPKQNSNARLRHAENGHRASTALKAVRRSYKWQRISYKCIRPTMALRARRGRCQ